MNKLIIFPLVLLSMLLSIAQSSYADNTVRISERSCKFTVDIPQGWERIPTAAIKEKIEKVPVSLALYPKDQTSYFSDNYILISVLPSIKALSNFSFKNIIENVNKMNEESRKIQTNSLKIEYDKTENYIADGHYHISTKMIIHKDSVGMSCMQDLLLTKFGYISVSCYAKNGYAQKEIGEMAQLISKNIKVEPDYQYSEPKKQSVFSLRNIGISVGIGLVVFVVITLLGKKKK